MHVLRLLVVVVTVALFGGVHPDALAQGYPSKPVNLIVPFKAGGGTDRQGRLVEPDFEQEFGQPLVFVYKPGASGAIGANELAGAANDGYNIAVYTFPLIVMNALTGKGQYKLEDFDYLAVASTDRAVLVTNKDGGKGSLADLVADAKARPGRVTIGTVESLGPTHIVALQLAELTGTDVNIVTLAGGSKGLAAVLGDQVDALIANRGATRSSASKLNYLAIASEDRDAAAPDVPTFREQGVDVVSSAARIWIAPRGLPTEVRSRLIAGFRNIYAKESVIDKQNKAGQVVNFQAGDALEKLVMDYAVEAKQVLSKHGLLK